jgi:predicted N-acetyltransferase YhbS
MAAVPHPVRASAPFVFSIETERPSDVSARETLLDRAIGPGRRRKSSEKIRRGRVPAEGLSLIARCGNGVLIGTVRLWNVSAGTAADGCVVSALLLGPLAVDDCAEGRGVGASLMRTAISEARSRGHGAILLVGDPAYYVRFGFSATHAAHLSMPGPFERHRLLALELIEGHLAGADGTIAPSGRFTRPNRTTTKAHDCSLPMSWITSD